MVARTRTRWSGLSGLLAGGGMGGVGGRLDGGVLLRHERFLYGEGEGSPILP